MKKVPLGIFLFVSFFFVLLGRDSNASGSRRIDAKYPIVLAHGLLASTHIFSMKRINRHLRWNGLMSYLVEVDGANSVKRRAQQLRIEVDKVLRYSGKKKVNIIGHSMGGLDARYLISTLGYGDKVASLTTISTPHRGSPVADEASMSIGESKFPIEALVNFAVAIYNGTSKLWTANLSAALKDLTTETAKSFNKLNLDSEQVYYQSFGANALLDPQRIHQILEEPYEHISSLEGANDGLVSVQSSQWGVYRGTLPADHLRVVGIRLHPGDWTEFNYRSAFLKVAQDLIERGF